MKIRDIATAATVAMAAIVLGAGCSRGVQLPEAAAQTTTEVATANVVSDRLPEMYEAGGVVRARTTAAVTSRLLAPVLQLSVAPGDTVRRGQILARLDDRDLAAQHRRAVSGRQGAKQGGRAAEAERDAARAALALATARHKRISLLYERQSATDDELDEAVAALRAVEARVASADAHVAEAAESLSAASAEAEAAGVGSSWAVITAPFDGVITEKLVEPGNMAAPGMPLLRIEQRGSMRVDVRLDESRIGGVKVGDAVELLLDRFENSDASEVSSVLTPRQVTGCVTEIARAAEAGAHAFLVKIDLPPDVRAASGTFARARFKGPSREALVVPRGALVRHGQITTVFVVDNGRARVRLVSIADAEHDTPSGAVRAVLSGVRPGEQVVVNPPPSLHDSASVRVVGGAVAEARKRESL